MTAVGHDMGLAFSGRGVRLSRVRVPWTRGATTGAFLVLLGAWAGLVPFIGPYMNFAYTPQTNTTWHWTAARGWFEVLPGVVALVAGLMLLISTYRRTAIVGSWLGIAAGAWLIVGPSLAGVLNQNLGTPDPASRKGVQALEQLFFFYGLGALIVLVAAVALGRLSVQTLRDLTAAERRAATTAAAAAASGPVEVMAPEAERQHRHAAPPETTAALQPVAASEPIASAQPMAPSEPLASAETRTLPEIRGWPETPHAEAGAHRPPYRPPATTDD